MENLADNIISMYINPSKEKNLLFKIIIPKIFNNTLQMRFIPILMSIYQKSHTKKSDLIS